MQPADLRQFINHLESDGDLARVGAGVDPHLEVAAIVREEMRGRNRALLFERVAGHGMPVAVNLFGSAARMARALGGASLAVPAARVRDTLAVPSGAPDAADALRKALPELSACVVEDRDPPCFAMDATAKGLLQLPALQAWPGDGGRYLTLGQVYTSHPETGETNCGLYRLQLVDRDRALLRCHPGSGGAAHLAAWQARGEAMPVAIALGGPPVMTCLAALPLPAGVGEVQLAAWLGSAPLAMARCLDGQLAVPATAEIVIEGRVLPGEELPEGPFGNHTGTYAAASPAPVVRVERIRLRDRAVYPCTVVGPPPTESLWFAELARQLLLPLLQCDQPWIVDVGIPPAGAYHRGALVTVARDCPPLAELVRALEASALLRGTRLLVLLDGDANADDPCDAYWRAINARKLPDGTRTATGGMVIDARTPTGVHRVSADEAVERTVRKRWREYGLEADAPLESISTAKRQP